MKCNIALIKVVVIVIALAVAAAAGRAPEAQRDAPVMWLCLGIAALVGLAQFRRRPSLCSICDNPLRRTADEWKIDGWKCYLRPHCHQRMVRQQRADAFAEFRSRRR
jgi:hypothetical protein